MKSNKIEITSYIIMAIFLISAFYLHLMSSVIAGTVVFLLIKKLRLIFSSSIFFLVSKENLLML